jgi:hypothetical protein
LCIPGCAWTVVDVDCDIMIIFGQCVSSVSITAESVTIAGEEGNTDDDRQHEPGDTQPEDESESESEREGE